MLWTKNVCDFWSKYLYHTCMTMKIPPFSHCRMCFLFCRYRLWQKVWSVWTEFVQLSRCKRKRRELAHKLTVRKTLSRAWKGWSQYVLARREKKTTGDQVRQWSMTRMKRYVNYLVFILTWINYNVRLDILFPNTGMFGANGNLLWKRRGSLHSWTPSHFTTGPYSCKREWESLIYVAVT